MSSFEHPDVLVLGGGGILGEAWMTAVLAGLEQASGFDPCRCEGYVGTSAGSIVSAGLAAGRSPGARLGEMPQHPAMPDPNGTSGHRLIGQALALGGGTGRLVAAPLAAAGLRLTAPGGALLRRAVLGRVSPGRRSLGGLGQRLERAGARFDGRLAVAAVALESGRRVVFGTSGAPTASVGEAVEASCAIPGFFQPVTIGGRSYVDGGAWSPTNMDAARVRRGTRVLCLNPTGGTGGGRPTPLSAFAPISRSIANVEALALRRRGARVRVVSPDSQTVIAIAGNLMDPGPRAAVTSAGFAQGRSLAASA